MGTIFRSRPVAVLFAGAVLISFSGVFVKLSHVPPSVSAFYRAFLGAVALFFACCINRDLKSRGFKKNSLAVLCGLFFALDLWAWHISIRYIGPGLSTILANLQVFILSLAGIWLFKEILTLRFVFSLPMAFTGLFLLVGMDIDQLSEKYITGVLFGLATAVFYSLFLLLMRKLQSDQASASLFYYQMLVSFACAGFLGFKVLLSGESFGIPDGQTLWAILGLGVLNQAFAWVLIVNAMPHVNASLAGLILLLQPALSFFWDVWFFDRQTGAMGWLGFFIVLIAIYFGMSHKQKEKK